MKIFAAYRRNRWSAFVVALLAATLFAASPIASFAHLLGAHGSVAAQQSDDGQETPHATLCKLCLGFVAGAAAADNHVPSFELDLLPQQPPNTAIVGLIRPIPFAPYRSRAPPRSLVV
jgi:hypothetical protein